MVFGILDPSNSTPTTMFSVDGDNAANYTVLARSTSEGMLFGAELYAVQNLTLGDHELVVTNVNGTGPIVSWLDYFHIEQEIALPKSGLPASSSSCSSTPTTTDMCSDTRMTPSHSRTAALAAGIVSVAVIAVVLSLVIMYARRRRRAYCDQGAPPVARSTVHLKLIMRDTIRSTFICLSLPQGFLHEGVHPAY